MKAERVDLVSGDMMTGSPNQTLPVVHRLQGTRKEAEPLARVIKEITAE
jgi:hypothetical protein